MTTFKQVSAALVANHGWIVGDSTGRAELRRSTGLVSLGLDGKVIEFFRYHPTGYPLANLVLGSVGDNATVADVLALL